MKLTKQIARYIVFPGIVSMGLERLLLNTSDNNHLNIYYHGVVNSDSNYFSPRHIHIEQFEQQIRYFKKHFDIVSIKDAFKIKQKKMLSNRHTISISFDDGYQNNLKVALPILNKYDVNATFFISGICTESNENNLLWTDIIAFAKYFCKEKKVVLQGVEFIDFIEVETGKSMKDFLKHKSRNYRDSSMDELKNRCSIIERQNEIPSEIWKLLSPSELIELSKNSNVTIGSHGYNHYNLGGISIAESIEDMKSSKVALEKVVGSNLDMICYPDGSYGNDVMNAAIEMGFEYNICCDYNSIEDSKNPNIVNRYGIANTTTFSSNIFFINRNFKTKGI